MKRLIVYRATSLTTEHLAQEIVDITGKDQLYFYDAAAPIVEKNN